MLQRLLDLEPLLRLKLEQLQHEVLGGAGDAAPLLVHEHHLVRVRVRGRGRGRGRDRSSGRGRGVGLGLRLEIGLTFGVAPVHVCPGRELHLVGVRAGVRVRFRVRVRVGV